MPRARSPQKIRLESWHLKRVPFPAIPFVDPFNVDPLRNGAVFDPNLRLEEIKKLRDEILKRGFGREVQPWNWLWARKNMGKNLGMGKTAFLTYIVNQINRDCGKIFLDELRIGYQFMLMFYLARTPLQKWPPLSWQVFVTMLRERALIRSF